MNLNDLDLSFEQVDEAAKVVDETGLKIDRKINTSAMSPSFSEMLEQAKPENTKKMDTWEVAELFTSIVHHEDYSRFFKKAGDFYEWVNKDAATVNTDIKAVDFDKLYHFDRNIYSLTKVFELSRTGDDYPQFLNYLLENNKDLKTMTIRQMRIFINRFYGREQKDVVEIIHDRSLYRIPTAILNRYQAELFTIDDDPYKDMNCFTDVSSFSWRVTNANVAYKKIDKTVFLSNQSGIPEDIRFFWGIESMEPGETKSIETVFSEKTYELVLKRALNPEPYRTKMIWHSDFSSELQKKLSYQEWVQNPESFYMMFEKLDTDRYAVEVVKKM